MNVVFNVVGHVVVDDKLDILDIYTKVSISNHTNADSTPTISSQAVALVYIIRMVVATDMAGRQAEAWVIISQSVSRKTGTSGTYSVK